MDVMDFSRAKDQGIKQVNTHSEVAPGWPGVQATWTSGAKQGVGTAFNNTSAVWFTISNGILNEIYYPRVDQACTRHMQFVVTDGSDFVSEEKNARHQVEYIAKGVPAYRITNTCPSGNYKLEKEIITDPFRNSVLQQVRFVPLTDKIKNFHLNVILAPHLGNHGAGNTAWIGDYKGVQMLFAERDGLVLAVACSQPWQKASVGYAGVSDGMQDLMQNKQLTWSYRRAENGNVSLAAEIALDKNSEDTFLLAIGFGKTALNAAQRARASVLEGFEEAKKTYIEEWQEWQKTLHNLKPAKKDGLDLFRISTMVIRTHAAKRIPGGLIASLSIPWGFSKGDDDLGGYHLVWPRDLVETATGLLAAGAFSEVRKVINYLMVTQESDGHWNQNMWLDGTSYWGGIQLDETAFPILLADLAYRKGAIEKSDLKRFWPMVQKAAGFLIKSGPKTHQDRWEENSGYSSFTLAVEIAALLAAAEIANINNEHFEATFLREVADNWNSNLEKWIYVQNSELTRKHNVDGYYVRIAPQAISSDPDQELEIKNKPAGQNLFKANEIIGPDALALVRYGLRAADDPRILNTIRVIDSEVKVQTPNGPCWYRYNHDGYGEHKDGSPYNGIGCGRLWPLMTGERGHYEIAAGNLESARKMQKALELFANEGGMIPEQVWDDKDIPEKGLFFGRPSGSAMPLVWAHAEYITLTRSIKEKQIFDQSPYAFQRYVIDNIESPYEHWTFNDKITVIEEGKVLRLIMLAPALVHWTADNWKTIFDTSAKDTGLGVYIADLIVENANKGDSFAFTLYWPTAQKWEGHNFTVKII